MPAKKTTRNKNKKSVTIIKAKNKQLQSKKRFNISNLSRRTVGLVSLILFAVVASLVLFSSNAAFQIEPPNQWGKYYDMAGPQPGIVLRPSDAITVRTDGAVIENLEIKGGIWIEANNVTIRNVRVLGTAANGIFQQKGYTGLVMDRIEIIGQYKDGAEIKNYSNAIYGEGGGWTLRNSRVSGYPDGAKLHSNVVVENNYFFDNSRTYYIDPVKGRVAAHVDGLQAMGADNVVIRNNTFVADSRPGGNYDMASNLMIQNDKGPISNFTIENNRFSGGAYTTAFNSHKSNAGPHKNVVMRNNVFAGLAKKGYSQYGPYTVRTSADDVTVQNNYFADNSGVTSKIPDRNGSGTVSNPEAPVDVEPTEPVVDPPSTNPMTLALVGVTEGQVASGTISAEAVVTNVPGLIGVDFFVDNKLVNTQKTPPICLFDDNGRVCTPYDISGLSDGQHTLRAVLRYNTDKTLEKSVRFQIKNDSSTPDPTVPPVTTDPTPTPTTDTTPPTAPKNLSRSLFFDWTRLGYSMQISWQASTDNKEVAQYIIERNGERLGTTKTTSFKDTNVSANTQYNYSVKAQDTSGNTSSAGTISAKGSCFFIWCTLQ